jgi:AcrR family transcriptional regulator
MSTTLEQGDPQNPRSKILRALLDEVDQPDGPSTVGQLASSAGLTREAFYGHFPDRDAAVKRVRQIISSDLIALCMRSFVAHKRWTEQIWHTGHTVVNFYDEHPKLTRFLLLSPLEDPDAGPEDCLDPFQLFLAPGLEGLHHKPRDLYGELILATEIELLFSAVRGSEPLRGELPWLVFFALAPPLDSDTAVDFIETQLKQ